MSRRSPSRLARVLAGRWPLARSRSRSSSTARIKRLGFEPLERRELLSVSSLVQSFVSFPDGYERDDTPAQARNIAINGATQVHSIHRASDVDWVSFKLNEKSNVVVKTSGVYGDTELWLFGPDSNSTEIAYANDSAGSRFARLDRLDSQALGAGTYYVKVGEFGRDAKVPRYLLSVKATPVPVRDVYETDDSADSATEIKVDGAPQIHTLHVGADVDWVKFNLVTRTDVVIETRGVAGDTQMSLFKSTDTAQPLAVDDDGGKGDFARILRFGQDILETGWYHLKVEAADQLAIASYTLTVTALQPGDIFLENAAEGLSAAIRLSESKGLGVPLERTYSHAAIYLGSSQVAEMLAKGHAIRPIAAHFADADLVDIYRHNNIGTKGADVATQARSYANTPYAFSEVAVLGLAALNPNAPNRVKNSLVFQAYARFDAGSKRMTCSELVARTFAAVDASLAIDVKLWPTMAAINSTSIDFEMDFTTPTMLGLSSDLRRLNA